MSASTSSNLVGVSRHICLNQITTATYQPTSCESAVTMLEERMHHVRDALVGNMAPSFTSITRGTGEWCRDQSMKGQVHTIPQSLLYCTANQKQITDDHVDIIEAFAQEREERPRTRDTCLKRHYMEHIVWFHVFARAGDTSVRMQNIIGAKKEAH